MKLSARRAGLLFAASVLAYFGVWRWANDVLVPAYTASVLARKRPIGNNSDLYPVWLTARKVLVERKPAYSPELTRDIQRGYYGRLLDPNNPEDPTNLQAFVYPLYVIFFLAPTVGLPFVTVANLFRWLLPIGTVLAMPLWMHAVKFRRPWLATAAVMVLSVSNFPAVAEDRQQNLSVLVVLMLAGAMAGIVRRWLRLGGLLLALATVKPQLSGLLIAWVLLWAVSDWERRRGVVWSFAATLFGLVAAATVVSPGWMRGFSNAVLAYRSYATGPSVFQVILPPVLAVIVTGSLVGFVAVACWQARKLSADSPEFAWTLALVVSATVTLITQAPHYQFLLAPALLLLAASSADLCKMSFLVRALAKGAFACLLWQWGAALGLALCSTFAPASRLYSMAELPLYTLLALPVLTLAAVLGVVFSTLSAGLGRAKLEPVS